MYYLHEGERNVSCKLRITFKVKKPDTLDRQMHLGIILIATPNTAQRKMYISYFNIHIIWKNRHRHIRLY